MLIMVKEITFSQKRIQIIIKFLAGNGLWKYLPSKMYKDFAKHEEKAYDIVLKIINKTVKEEQMDIECDNESVLLTILKTNGLDMRDKISGVMGKLTMFYIKWRK